MEKAAITVLIENIKKIIKANGYRSIEQFAYENQLNKGGLGKVLQGKRIPRFDTVIKLAEALEVTLNDLYPMGKAAPQRNSSKRLRLEKIKVAHAILSEVLKEQSKS